MIYYLQTMKWFFRLLLSSGFYLHDKYNNHHLSEQKCYKITRTKKGISSITLLKTNLIVSDSYSILYVYAKYFLNSHLCAIIRNSYYEFSSFDLFIF